MFDLRRVHEYSLDHTTGQTKLVHINPALRVKVGSEAPVFVQGGQVCSEGGQPLSDIPDWFWAEARTMSVQARQEVGLVLPEEHPQPKPLTRIDQDETSDDDETEDLDLTLEPFLGHSGASEGHSDVVVGWQCPDCGESVKNTLKGVHIARHRRMQKRGK